MQTLAVHDVNATIPVMVGVDQELLQYFSCRYLAHLVQVNGISHTEMAASQAAKQALRISWTEKQQLLTRLKFRRVPHRLKQFLQHGCFVPLPLLGYGAWLLGLPREAIIRSQGLHAAHCNTKFFFIAAVI